MSGEPKSEYDVIVRDSIDMDYPEQDPTYDWQTGDHGLVVLIDRDDD